MTINKWYLMQLLIDEFGAFVGKKENLFVITKDKGKKKEEFSADNLNQIIFSRGSAISSDAVKLAMEKGIDIVFLGNYGMPCARIYPCKLGGTTLTRRMQAELYFSGKAIEFVKKIVEAKVKNQAYFLKSLEKTREISFGTVSDEIIQSLEVLKSISGKIDDARNELLGIEGRAASIYFSCLSKIIPFERREHEAKDPFNAVLNYGYGILYGEIEKACILAGLDPYLGFFHTDRYNKPSMVLDLIEEFRQPIVDRAIVTLFSRKEIDESDFEKSGDSLMLSKSGRKKIITAVLERLHTEIKYNGKKQSFQKAILGQARNFVNFLLGESAEYEAFVYRW